MSESTTTRKMLMAPRGAIYIWPSRDLFYPRMLAKKLGRSDLEFHGPSFSARDLEGRQISGLVIDPEAAVRMSRSDLANFLRISRMVERAR